MTQIQNDITRTRTKCHYARQHAWRQFVLRGLFILSAGSLLACVAAAAAFPAPLDMQAEGRAGTATLNLAQLEPGAPTLLGTPGGAVQQAPGTELGAASGRNWQATLGLGAGIRPEYPGSGKIRVSPIPAVSATYRDRLFASTTEGLGVYVWRSPSLQVGASLNIADDIRYHGTNASLRGLPKIKPGGLAALFARYEVGPFAFNADIKERIGYVNGVSADIGASYRFHVQPNWSLAVGPSLTFASAKLNNAFFGVTQSDAARAAKFGNNIQPFRPNEGVRDVALNATSNYRLNDHWGLASRLDLAVLVGQDGHSPITRQRFQPSFGSFVYYKF